MTESPHAAPSAVLAYAETLSPAHRAVCGLLRDQIEVAIPGAASKVWHGSPVWFLDENPVVGYSSGSKGVSLLFWNGQGLGEAGLKPVGKYFAAQATFQSVDEVDIPLLCRWLKSASENVFNSRAYFKNLRASKGPSR